MEKEIRILIVEDSDAHHELVLRELKNAEIAFTSRRVQTEKEFVRELTDFYPTLILCDYMLPTFDGMSAFKLVQEIAPHTPFIIVTASMNEETAVQCMKAGVADYVLKEHIGLLRAAVKSALERKDSSEALKKSKTQLAEAEHMVKLGSWEWDWRTDEIYWSDEIYNIFDVPPGTKPSLEAFMEKLHPEDREAMASRIREIKEKGPEAAQVSPTTEYRMIHRTGEVRYVVSTMKMLKTEEGQVVKLIGTIQDISELKLKQAKLFESENRLRLMFELEPQCVKLLDREGTILEINPTGLVFLECASLEEARTQKLELFVAPEHRAAFKALSEKIFLGESGELEFEIIGLKGTRRRLYTRAVPFRNSEGKIVALLEMATDITKSRLLEEQLRQSQKMEAVGQLAGGIAHDFNNVLTVISGYSDLILSTLAKDDSHYLDLQEIKKAAERAQGLTGQLLAFSRREAVYPKPTDLNEVLKNMDNMLRRLIGEDIDFKMLLAENLPSLWLIQASFSRSL